MTPFELPLQPTAQALVVFLRSTQYRMVVKWNPFADCWVADFYDSDGVEVLTGIAFVTGADLLEQFGYLDIGLGALLAQSDNNADAVPTFTNLGVEGHVYYLTGE